MKLYIHCHINPPIRLKALTDLAIFANDMTAFGFHLLYVTEIDLGLTLEEMQALQTLAIRHTIELKAKETQS